MYRYIFLSLLFFGCFDQHGRGTDAGVDAAPDAPNVQTCFCCGAEVEWPAEVDCGLGACDPYCLYGDSGLPDAGTDTGSGDCSPMALHALCDYQTVPIGTPSRITGLLGDGDGCYCGETLDCSARIREPGVIDMSTALCSSDVLCDACYPYVEGECELPALTEGEWDVYVNGTFAFQVSAEDSFGPFVPPDRCQRAAMPDCGTAMPSIQAPTGFCHISNPTPGRAEIRVFHECPPCAAEAGPCEVRVVGDQITVETTSLGTCDLICPPVCTPREDVCLTPRLEPGVYRVAFEGTDFESILTVGSDEYEEICGPATLEE